MSLRRFMPGASAAAATVLALAALAAYRATFSAPFFFDDLPAIVDNPTIRHLGAIGTVLSPPSADGNSAGGRPLVNLSFALNYALSGERVWSYHALNLTIHIIAALTLFGIVRRTLVGQAGWSRRGDATSRPGLQSPASTAFAIALLWTLHPLLTESVTCVVQRTESMMGLFYLLTLYGFVRCIEGGRRPPGGGISSLDPARTIRRPEVGGHLAWASLSVLACLLGMATKETMVTAPVVILLYDRTFVSGSFREAWRRHRALHLALASTWILLGFLLVRSGGSRGASAGFGLGLTPWSYALTQCQAIVHYLRLCFWPHPLIVDYGTGAAGHLREVAPQAAVLLVLLAGTVLALARRPAAGFLGACFFIILAPSSSVVPLVAQTIAEHRMYLPLAAVIALAVGGGWSLAERVDRAWPSLRPPAARCYVPCLIGMAGFLGILTARRNEAYRSVLSIWTDTVAHRPENARAHTDLGNAQIQLGDLPAAIARYREALQLDPKMPDAHYNLAVALVRSGKVDEAVAEFRRSLQLHPNAWVAEQANYNLATTLARLHRLPEAIECLQQALLLRPDHTEARTHLASALLASGRTDEALVQFEEALSADPGSPIAQFNLANLLAQKGRFDEAVSHYRKALQFDPGYAKAHCNLGGALVQLGRMREAAGEFHEALRLNPGMTEARDNLRRVETYLQANP